MKIGKSKEKCFGGVVCRRGRSVNASYATQDGRKEHISERIGNLAVSLAGILARKVLEACQHIGFFSEERVSWRSLCVHQVQ